MTGRYFDEWSVGDRIAHQPHRTVTETDNLLQSALTHNPQPLHLDETYAEGTEFGRIVVNGKLRPGVFAKDVILTIIRRLGVNGGVGYAYELTEVADGIRAGRTESPVMPLDDTLAVQRILNEASEQLGVIHHEDATVAV